MYIGKMSATTAMMMMNSMMMLMMMNHLGLLDVASRGDENHHFGFPAPPAAMMIVEAAFTISIMMIARLAMTVTMLNLRLCPFASQPCYKVHHRVEIQVRLPF